MSALRLDLVEDAITAIAAGRPVVVVDDEDRENEGDLILGRRCRHPLRDRFRGAPLQRTAVRTDERRSGRRPRAAADGA